MKTNFHQKFLVLPLFFSIFSQTFLYSVADARDLQLVPEVLGSCEYPESKSYNKDMILHRQNFQDHDDWQELLPEGHVFLSYKVLNLKELQENFSKVTMLHKNDVFSKGLLMASHGLYMTEKKEDRYFDPKTQISKDVVEGTSRKLTLVKTTGDFSVELDKFVKIANPVAFSMHIKFTAFSGVYHKDLDQWDGESQFFLNKAELNFFTSPMLTNNEHLKHKHTVVLYTQGKEKMLRGTYFITNVFEDLESGKQLMETWHFVSIETNWIMSLALKLFPGVFKKTLFRDYSRQVDFTRSYGNLSALID